MIASSKLISPPPALPATSQPTAMGSRELGLDLAQIAARYLFHTDHLHYGYWPSELPVEMANLREAQENYVNLILETIPSGVSTILDVGAGTGALAKRLKTEGYQVDCVSPSPHLTQKIRTKLGDEQQIFESKYEDVKTERRYDLILFSESFQYIKLKTSLGLSMQYLNPGGHILICDYFRNDTPDKGPFGGGHPLSEFRIEVARHDLTMLVDKDITPQTAPNLDLVADCVLNAVMPMKQLLFDFAACKYPLPYRLLTWLFRKPLAHFDTKYMGGKRSGANFQVYKSYRLLLFHQGVTHPAG